MRAAASCILTPPWVRAEALQANCQKRENTNLSFKCYSGRLRGPRRAVTERQVSTPGPCCSSSAYSCQGILELPLFTQLLVVWVVAGAKQSWEMT